MIGGDLSAFDGLELIQNNSTRWNSWFHSITRALNVRERLELFSARHVPAKGSQGIANFKLDVSGKSTAGARPQWTRTSLETLGYSESKDLAGMFEKELGTQANL